LTIPARQAQPADYAALAEISTGSPWALPNDHGVHALGTDVISRAVLAGGLLYPCQAIFSDSRTPALFSPIPYPGSGDDWKRRYHNRPFLIIEGRGVIVSKSMAPAELAMISGLAQVVQRIHADAPLRYLTPVEAAGVTSQAAYRYRELASAGRGVQA
jgi:hypothetical protein